MLQNLRLMDGGVMGVMGGRSGDIITSGLALSLDAGNVASYSGAGTTWADLSGKSVATTLQNPAYTSDKGGGLVFSSTSTTGSMSGLANFSGGFTLEVWVKHATIGGTQRYFGLGSTVDGPCIRSNGAGVQGFIYNAAGSVRIHTSYNTISASSYLHLIYLYDGAAFRLYRNNEEVAVSPEVFALPTASGGGYISSGEYFNGNLYICRYYNRGLSAAEVSQNFNALRGRFGI